MKTIILCFDVVRGFGLTEAQTNTFKLWLALTRDAEQLPLYLPIPAGSHGGGRGETLMKMLESLVKLEWVGSVFTLFSLLTDARELDEVKRYALGDGVARQMQSACELLLDHWTPSDRLAIFGNSHSAAVALLFTQFLHEFGLVRPEMREAVPELIRHFFKATENVSPPQTALFRSGFAFSCPVTFVGIWDCVHNVSWLGRPASVRADRAVGDGTEIRHAISIDERRSLFEPLILSPVPSSVSNTRTREVWFAGVHADVMGLYPERESGLSQISLEWMFDQATSFGLRFDAERRSYILGSRLSGAACSGWPDFARPDPEAPAHQSLLGISWISEMLPRRRRNGRGGWYIPLGRRRRIPEDAFLHRSVQLRMNSPLGYHPPNLPERYQFEG